MDTERSDPLLYGSLLSLKKTSSVQRLMWSALMCGAVLLLVYLLKSWARIAYMVTKLPGPPALPIIGNLLDFMKRDEIWANSMRLLRDCTPVGRLWLTFYPVVVLTTAQSVQSVLGSSKHIDKGFFYTPLHPFFGDGLVTSSGSKWQAHRRLITPTFHFSILEKYVEVFVRKAESFVESLKTQIGNKGFDITPFTYEVTMDIFCETVMGVAMTGEDGNQLGIVSAFHMAEEIMMHRVLHPWLLQDWIFNFSSLSKEQTRCCKVIQEFADKLVQDRKKAVKERKLEEEFDSDAAENGKKKPQVFLDLLIEASQNGTLLSDRDIREELITFMNGGQTTTAASINYCLYLLGCNPEVQDKAVKEQDEIFGDSDRAATMQDLKEMYYLERCIKEALRIYPSIPVMARRVGEDVTLGKHTIPEGCDVAILPHILHRNPEYFPDPETFNPDNFLPERVQTRHPYAYVPFSAGPRNCIGQKFAFLEEKALISAVLRNVRLESVTKREELILYPNIVLASKNGIKIKVHSREQAK